MNFLTSLLSRNRISIMGLRQSRASQPMRDLQLKGSLTWGQKSGKVSSSRATQSRVSYRVRKNPSSKVPNAKLRIILRQDLMLLRFRIEANACAYLTLQGDY